MATCVPNVHLHLLLWTTWVLWVGNANYFLEVGATDGDIVNLVEAVLAETERNR